MGWMERRLGEGEEVWQEGLRSFYEVNRHQV